MLVSIIIPTYNEAPLIFDRVRACCALRPRPEVLVADGGSSDSTLPLARAAGGRTLEVRPRGRAFQMNAGARLAEGEVLLFLHADVELLPRAFSALRRALKDPELVGGAFARRFDSSSRLLEWGSRLADLRGTRLQIYLGDQAIFVRREVFRRMGGFPEILLFEDLALSRVLKKFGRTRLIEEPVLASSRRFERQGHLGRLARNVGLTALYFLGANPDRLARRYYPGYFPPASRRPLNAKENDTGSFPPIDLPAGLKREPTPPFERPR